MADVVVPQPDGGGVRKLEVTMACAFRIGSGRHQKEERVRAAKRPGHHLRVLVGALDDVDALADLRGKLRRIPRDDADLCLRLEQVR